MSQTQGVANVVQVEEKWVYYTGKDQNSVKASRAAVAEDIKAGYCVTYDMYGWDQGRGIDVIKPVTNALDRPAGIVTFVPPGNERGGWVKIATKAASIRAWTHANMTGAPTTRILLAMVNGDWGLNVIIPSVASGAANADTFCRSIAIANEALDTSGTAAYANVQLGAVGGCPI